MNIQQVKLKAYDCTRVDRFAIVDYGRVVHKCKIVKVGRKQVHVLLRGKTEAINPVYITSVR